MSFWHIILAAALILALAIAVEAWLKRNRPHRPLAQKMHDPDTPDTSPQLGLEATDMTIMDEAVRANNRSSMTQDSHLYLRRNPFATFRAKRPRPMPDDETYSKLFYDAFQKSEKGADQTPRRKK